MKTIIMLAVMVCVTGIIFSFLLALIVGALAGPFNIPIPMGDGTNTAKLIFGGSMILSVLFYSAILIPKKYIMSE